MKLIKLKILVLILFIIAGCNERKSDSTLHHAAISTINQEGPGNEVWKMEEQYWVYVLKNDTIGYKTMWHDDFIGYPSFGNGASNKAGIASWIPQLHKDLNLKFSYQLHKKAVNVIDDVVLAFYDVDEIWTDGEKNIVRKETLKVTHTWKKYGRNWLILGGMAAIKDQDEPVN